MSTTQTAPAPVPAPQQTPPSKDTKGSKKDRKDTPTETLGGVLIPGGIITGLIGLCWLSHAFGLGVVIAALIACAMAATAVLAIRGRRDGRAQRRMAPLGAGGGGSGRGGSSRRGGGGRGATGGGSRGGSRSGSGGGSPRGGGRSRGGATAPGPNAKKPGGMGATKSPSGGLLGGSRNAPSKRPGGKGGSAKGPSGGAEKERTPTRRGLLGAMSPGGSGSSKTPRKPNQKNTPAGKSGKAKPDKNGGLGRLGAGLGMSPKRAGGGTSPKHKSPKPKDPKRSDRNEAKLRKAAKKNRGHDGSSDSGGTPKLDKLTAKPKTKPSKDKAPKSADAKGKDSKPKKPKAARVSHGAPMGPARKAAYWAGRKMRQHTSRAARRRVRNVTGAARSIAHGIGRASTPLAYAWRYGSRAFLSAHMALGSVRYTGVGPNWMRPLAQVLHACTTPFARAVAASGSWGWLNAWIYTRTGGGRDAGTTRRTPRTVAEARPIRPHTPVTRPAAAAPPTAGGIPAMAHDLTPALPLVAAIDAVRTAGAMLLIHPADNMVGYELTMKQLAELEYAISDVVRAAAMSTRENFKVHPAVPEAYDDTAAYMRTTGDRLQAIPYLFRLLHEQQFQNIENPTPQGAKWDITANN